MSEKFWTHLKLKNGDTVKFVPPAPNGEQLGGITENERDKIKKTDGKIDVLVRKNLLNPDNKCVYFIAKGNHHVQTAAKNVDISYYVNVEPNTDYTIYRSAGSTCFVIGATNRLENNAPAQWLYTTDITNVFDSEHIAHINSGQFSILIIQVAYSDNTKFPEKVQVQKGKQFTKYEPYIDDNSENASLYALTAEGEYYRIDDELEVKLSKNPSTWPTWTPIEQKTALQQLGIISLTKDQYDFLVDTNRIIESNIYIIVEGDNI